jgi:alpha-mannosidase
MDNRAITTAQNQTTASRQVIVSNEKDFFEDFQAAYGNTIPTQSCGFGNEWDLYSASMAEVSAAVRRSVEKLRGAEALATLVSLRKPNFMQGRESARNRAWVDLGLYWEHDWTADGPVGINTRATWERRLAGEIKSYVDTLQADATRELGALIRRGTSGNARFFVFNPLSWMRTDVADLPLSDMALVHVVDVATNVEAPSQIVTIDGVRTLRILARDIPSVGYKVFEIRPGAGENFSNAATAAGTVIENEFYRVTVADRGAITSLIDKERGSREFARLVGGRAMNDLGAGVGSVSVENAGPVSVTLLATGSSPLQHTTRISLLRGLRRIEIRNDIEQNFSGVQSWAFGFNLNTPDVWHEEIGAVIRAKYLGGGGHYSPRGGRYDWLSLNHFADMSGQGVGVTLSSADCAFMKLGQSASKVLDNATAQISALAGGQVDGGLGIPNQGGDSHFLQRFALRTHSAYNQADAMRFALEHQNPLLAGGIVGGDAYPENSFSLLTLSDPDVLLWSLKPAEEGIGLGMIARVWNQKSAAVTLTVAMPSDAVAGARRLTHLETNLDEADTQITGEVLTAPLAPQQIGTFLIKPQGGVSVGLAFLKVE